MLIFGYRCNSPLKSPSNSFTVIRVLLCFQIKVYETIESATLWLAPQKQNKKQTNKNKNKTKTIKTKTKQTNKQTKQTNKLRSIIALKYRSGIKFIGDKICRKGQCIISLLRWNDCDYMPTAKNSALWILWPRYFTKSNIFFCYQRELFL